MAGWAASSAGDVILTQLPVSIRKEEGKPRLQDPSLIRERRPFVERTDGLERPSLLRQQCLKPGRCRHLSLHRRASLGRQRAIRKRGQLAQLPISPLVTRGHHNLWGGKSTLSATSSGPGGPGAGGLAPADSPVRPLPLPYHSVSTYFFGPPKHAMSYCAKA